MKKYLAVLTILIITYACATVQPPAGGEKDEIPPTLITSTPEHQSLNFDGTEIKLLFSEWMKVDQLQKELIITPRSEITFKHTLKKQLLTITLEEPLPDSTTYTFNFRKSMKDITEGNLWPNPVLAFSTGNYLDSMEIAGKVINILTQEPEEGFTVGLYNPAYDTANLRQGEPIYFTTTNDKGEYKLQNLKPDTYLLYGFQDTNNNLQNEPESEAYAFHPSKIELYDSIAPINLSSYKSNEDTLRLKKAAPSGRDFVVDYNKGIANFRIINLATPGSYVFANDEENAQKIRIYFNNFRNIAYDTDSVGMQIEVQDSVGNERIDTVYVKFRESRVKAEEMKITKMPQKDILPGKQNFLIKLNKPAYSVNTDSMYIKYDSVLIQNIDREDISLSNDKKQITISTQIIKANLDSIDAKRKQITDSIAALPKDTTTTSNTEEESTDQKSEENTGLFSKGKGEATKQTNAANKNIIRGLHLYIGQGSFIGVEADSTASNHIVFQFMKEENYGTITGNVVGADSANFIIQLLNNSYEVVDTLYNRKEFTFTYVKPGDYNLRVIIDKNENRRWDPGNAIQLIPHEEIIYLNETFPVRTNWIVVDKNIVLKREKDVDKNLEN